MENGTHGLSLIIKGRLKLLESISHELNVLYSTLYDMYDVRCTGMTGRFVELGLPRNRDHVMTRLGRNNALVRLTRHSLGSE